MNQGYNQTFEAEIANVFNKFFVSVVHSVVITINGNFLSNTGTSDHPVEMIICKYKNHRSKTYINIHMTTFELTFTFQPVTKNRTSNKLLNHKTQYSTK